MLCAFSHQIDIYSEPKPAPGEDEPDQERNSRKWTGALRETFSTLGVDPLRVSAGKTQFLCHLLIYLFQY